MKTLVVLSGLVLSAWAAPQVTFGANDESVLSCGIVNGEERNVGDTWADDCNKCICRETGIATCTKRFCGNIPVIRNPTESVPSCGIVNGEERNVGDTWADDCNKCICRETGIATCTKRFCGNIPVLKPGCTDSSGTSRQDGSSWKVECNTCTCNSGNVACTEALCGDKTGVKFAATCKNAINGEDRLEGERWTAADGCNTCRCLKSGIPGCTRKLCPNSPAITQPRDADLCSNKVCGAQCDTSDGFLQVVRYCQPDGSCGHNSQPVCSAEIERSSCPGCPQESPVDEDIVAAAAHATASLVGISDSGCGGIKLVNVEKAEKQVVAGTNFFLTLRLETRGGQGCADKTEKICQNIVVFKPLPFQCQSQDGCLELTRQTGISCKEVQPDNQISCPGCPQESPVDEDIVAAAAHATASLAGISDSGCGGIKLVNVENAQKQVVAGTNFFLTLRLETRGGQGCADKTEKICQNIVVFKPLPFQCQSGDGCLELTEQTGISCKEVQPGVCKNAINGEDRLEGERWTAADGCNTCRCLKSGFPGCTKKFCLDKPLIATSSPVRDNPVPCLGCPQESSIDEDIFSAAAHATASLAGVNTVSGCGGISLLKVEKAEKQVVAGTNYFLTLRLETRGGQGCADKIVKICENIVVFKPLPFACQSQDGCLELTRQPGISCKATSLFSLNTGLETSNIRQCTGDGKENCQAININNDVLDNISVGDQVNLLPSLNIELTLKQSPSQGRSSTSFVFTVGQFGEAIITRGNNRVSVFGSIKPGTGNVDYTIESCGDGCNVVYQRDSGFFNQFKD